MNSKKMTNKAILLSLAMAFSLPYSIYGCTCYSTQSFSLYEYDYSENIAELKIISKIKDDYKGRLAQHRIDTKNWDKSYPPPPPLPPNNYVDFEVELIQTFKGNLDLIDFKLRSDNSSCEWHPEAGKTYLLYLGDIIMENNQKIFKISACHRKIQKGSKRYELETKILKDINNQSNGKFKVDQNALLKDTSKQYHSVKGRFKNYKRHGKWKLSEPLMWPTKEIQPRSKVMVLKYKNGELISVKRPSVRDLGNAVKRTIFSWERFYIKPE